MTQESSRPQALDHEILAYYGRGDEGQRLFRGTGQLELARTQDLLRRWLPSPPAVVLDVGGGTGVYASWLARREYDVHLVDPVPLHVEQALAASASQPDYPLASAKLGDARHLDRADGSVDAVLLFGPLYHLTARADRITALSEARRVLRSSGLALAVGISRFASALDGLARGLLRDPEFVRIVQRDLVEGQHRNPQGRPSYFTTAFLHHPDELRTEVEAAGLCLEKLVAVEGPGWLLQSFDQQWDEPADRQRLLDVLRWLEHEPSLLGVSAHVMAFARKG